MKLPLHYSVKAKTKDNLVWKKEGDAILDKELIITEDLPYCTVEEIKAEMAFPLEKDDKIWINGYQTWTYSPEYQQDSRIRGIRRIPKFLVKKFSLDGYSDYHFVSYPYEKGILHGFTVLTIRRGDHFILLGSLDERKGWTLFTLDTNSQTLLIERDAKGLKTEGTYPLFNLFYCEGTEEEVFRSWFRAQGLEKPKASPLAGYSSWYNRYQNISEESIREDLKGMNHILEKGDLFQIDDGWEVAVGEWTIDKNKFPQGLKPLVDDIHRQGYLAGLWLAPFVAEEKSSIFQNHLDWFLKHEGQFFKPGCNWSGFYSLDIDHPEVIAYLEKTFDNVLNQWGFDLVKLDFLYGAAPYGKETETRAGRMFKGMEMLRKLCGDKLILGCGVPIAAGFQLTDYSRVSCDVGLDWNDKPHMRIIHRERVSTKQSMETAFFRRHFREGAYLVDPDVFFLREDNIALTREQKLLLGKADALQQGLFLTSDNPSLYTEEQIQDYKELRHLWKDAKDITVQYGEDGRRCYHYTLDGKEETLPLPF